MNKLKLKPFDYFYSFILKYSHKNRRLNCLMKKKRKTD